MNRSLKLEFSNQHKCPTGICPTQATSPHFEDPSPVLRRRSVSKKMTFLRSTRMKPAQPCDLLLCLKEAFDSRGRDYWHILAATNQPLLEGPLAVLFESTIREELETVFKGKLDRVTNNKSSESAGWLQAKHRVMLSCYGPPLKHITPQISDKQKPHQSMAWKRTCLGQGGE